MVGLKTLLSVDGVVATGIVRAVYPDLREREAYTGSLLGSKGRTFLVLP